jgi:sulfur-carrier protein adenylyltransferase/sulfurtransferase
MDLSRSELLRYSRQITLPEWGPQAQQRLAGSRVLVVGIGGLGSPVAMYLAAAGVGQLGLVDADRVDAANLHRQLLFRTGDVGAHKVDVAQRTLHEINPHVQVVPVRERLVAANAESIAQGFDLVVDGTDNFSTRYLVNDLCLRLGVPNVACAEAGVLGVLPGLMGMLQATEALKWLTGIGTSMRGRLLLVDALGTSFREVRLSRRPGCAGCGGTQPPPLIDYDAFCGLGPATPLADVPAAGDVGAISVQDWQARGDTAQVTLLDVREPWEYELAHLPGATLIPLGTLPAAVATLDPSRPTVVYCHHGMRSLSAARFLAARGFHPVWNLEGGIDAWSLEVDPATPRY